MTQKILCLANCSQILTLKGVHEKEGRIPFERDLGLLENASLVYQGDKILFVGQESERQKLYPEAEVKNSKGLLVTPEIVDSHTHLLFGGNRSREYAMRLSGASYQEIAKSGGGILSTSRATQEASRDELFESACERIERISTYGVGTLEIKSGYGLEKSHEIRCSRLIDDLKSHFKGRVQIFNTFMAAHAVPPHFKSSQDYMVKEVFLALEELSKEGILDAVDIFYEQGYFDKEDVLSLFERASKHSLPLKLHADELTDSGGLELAIEHGALSADHLLRSSRKTFPKLATSQTVATVLPGTAFFLGLTQARAREMIDQGARLALASDFNPGSCHIDNLPLLAGLSGATLKMSLPEIWTAITYNGAQALGLKNQGALIEGMKARFSFFQVSSHEDVFYSPSRNFARVSNDGVEKI